MDKSKKFDNIVSADVLGSIWLGASAGKIVEKTLNLIYPDTLGLLIGWTVAFIFSIVLVLYWKEIEAVFEKYLWDKL